MKIIAFFSRFTFICNIAFLIFLVFNRLEWGRVGNGGNSNVVDTIPYFKSLVITLGFSAIIINLLMCMVYAVILLDVKKIFASKMASNDQFCFFNCPVLFFLLLDTFTK